MQKEIDQEKIKALVERAITEKVFPGCQLGIIYRDSVGNFKTSCSYFGGFTYDPGSKRVDGNSIYDVASLTKTISTGFAILKLVEADKISLEDKIKSYLPEFQDEEAKILHLLTYTLDFAEIPKADKEKHLNELTLEEFRKNLFNLKFKNKGGVAYKYSDATADLQGRLVEKITRETLQEIFSRTIAPQLELELSSLNPDIFPPGNIVPSENSSDFINHARVHDPKARRCFEAGIYAGYAGLFSNVQDVLKVCAMFLRKGQVNGENFLREETIYKMQHDNLDLISGLPTPLCSGDNSTTDLRKMLGIKRQILGKSGFTGCQFLVDLDREVGLVILSNRTFLEDSSKDNYEKWHDFRKNLVKVVFY